MKFTFLDSDLKTVGDERINIHIEICFPLYQQSSSNLAGPTLEHVGLQNILDNLERRKLRENQSLQ